MFPHQDHVWFICCIFNTPCPKCAFSMLLSCIAHSHLLHTPLIPLSSIGLYLGFFILACHVYLMFCSTLFSLKIELYFLIHLASLMHHYHCSYLHLLCTSEEFLSFLHGSCVHPQGEKFYFLCTFVGGDIFHKGDAYIKREKTLC